MKTLTAFVLGVFVSLSLASSGLTVAFNQKSHKYHYLSCPAAKRCTVNCIEISLQEAIDRGGIPCKKCHPPAAVRAGEGEKRATENSSLVHH